MKTTLLSISLLFASSSLLSMDELSWVDEQVEAIKPPRAGLSKRELAHIKSPFIFLKKNRDEEEKKESSGNAEKSTTSSNATNSAATAPKAVKTSQSLSLEAIINKSALINNVWYKIGETINGYTIEDISRDSVLLKKKKKEFLLTTKTQSKKLKFQNK